MSNGSKKSIVVGGREYAGVADMPPEVRRVYELALSAKEIRGTEGEPNVKIFFNGKEYESIDSMPPDIRRLYENMTAALETSRDFRDRDATSPRAKKPAPAAAKVEAEIPTEKAAQRGLGNIGTKKVQRQKILLISGVALLVAVLLVFLLLKSG